MRVARKSITKKVSSKARYNLLPSCSSLEVLPQILLVTLTSNPCPFSLLNLSNLGPLHSLTVTALVQVFNISYGDD